LNQLLLAAAITTFALACSGCTSQGPRKIPIDRFDYNSAISASANEQMLLNLVRLRHSEVPTFLAVNSVLTQYVWAVDAGVAGAGGESLSFPAWSIGGSATGRYIERPTVTYSPLSGQEFAAQLISPVRPDVVFSLVSSGWPPDQLLLMTLQRINDIENIGFAPADGSRSRSPEFVRVVEMIVDLAKRNAIELVRMNSREHDESYLDFSETVDPQTQGVIQELKGILGLDRSRSRFRVTRKIVGRAPDEVTLRMHSLLELMGLLSEGVEDPQAQDRSTSASSIGALTPMRVRSQVERPVDAFVSVRFDENWYFVPRSDRESKRSFGMLNYLYQMQASQNQGAGPLLTVPVS